MRTVLGYVLVLVLAGCVTVEDYPKEWEPLPTARTGCPSVTGRYNSNSEANLNSPEPRVALARWLAPDVSLAYFANYVSFERTDAETLKVRWSRDEELVHEQSLSVAKGEFVCSSGWLKVGYTFTDSARSAPAVAGGSNYISLVATPDFLVANTSAGGAIGGVIPPNPIYPSFPFVFLGYESHWYRFKRVPID